MLKDIFKRVAASEYNSAALAIGGSTLAAIGTQANGEGAMLVAGVAAGVAGIAIGRVYDGVSDYVSDYLIEKRLRTPASGKAPGPNGLL